MGGKALLAPPPEELRRLGANFGPSTILLREYWRLVTFGFLSGNIIHFSLNVYALLEFGPLAQAALGRVRYLFIYLVSGIVGGMASILMEPTQTSVGASASLSGLLGALIITSWFKRQRDKTGGLSRPQIILLCIFLFYAFLLGLTSQFMDNAAHLGGFVTGILSAALLTFNYRSTIKLKANLAAGLALIAMIPVLAMLDVRRMENNPNVECFLKLEAAVKLLKEKKFLHGISLLNEALKISPNNVAALLARADALNNLAQPEDALKDIDKALSINKNDFHILARRAHSYSLLGRSREALADMDKVIEHDKQAIIFNNRSWMRLPLAFEGNAAKPDSSDKPDNRVLELSLKDADEALKRDKSLDTIYDTRGTIYLLLGDYDKAMADFDKCLALKDEGAAHLHRAVIFKLKDDRRVQDELTLYKKSDYKPEKWEVTYFAKLGIDAAREDSKP